MFEISYSQANTFRDCKRKWAYRYVDKRKGIPSLPAIRGNRYHSAIEQAILDDVEPVNEILSRAVAIFSRLGWENVKPEEYLEYIEGDYKVRGYADIVAEKDGKHYVLDWKFPGKHPGKKPPPKHVDQIQLYAYLLGSDVCVLAYPEHDTAFTFEADDIHGERILNRLIKTVKEIDESGAYEVPGAEQQPTPNFLCRDWCEYRDVCEFGGTYGR